ncbi:MAG: hypothetical protein ACOVMR_06010 [Flavobacteriales bacterium]
MIRVIILTLFCWVNGFSLWAQLPYDSAFISHLRKEGLTSQLDTYIDQLSASKDTICYLKSISFFLKNEMDSCIHYYEYGGAVALQDTCLQNCIAVRAIANPDIRTRWFVATDWKEVSEVHLALRECYFAYSTLSVMSERPEEWLLSNVYELKEQRSKRKSSAFFRSLLAPGWGRSYAGRKELSKTAFVMPATLGLQVAESAIVLGVLNPYTIVMFVGFQVFYIGEAVGAARDIAIIYQEKEEQFYIDAANYYSDSCTCFER